MLAGLAFTLSGCGEGTKSKSGGAGDYVLSECFVEEDGYATCTEYCEMALGTQARTADERAEVSLEKDPCAVIRLGQLTRSLTTGYTTMEECELVEPRIMVGSDTAVFDNVFPIEAARCCCHAP